MPRGRFVAISVEWLHTAQVSALHGVPSSHFSPVAELLQWVSKTVLRECWVSGEVATIPDLPALDSFNYTILIVAADGGLTIETWGIASYQENTFSQDPIEAQLILSFRSRYQRCNKLLGPGAIRA